MGSPEGSVRFVGFEAAPSSPAISDEIKDEDSSIPGISRRPRRRNTIVNSLFNYEQEFIRDRRASTIKGLSTPVEEEVTENKKDDNFPMPTMEEISDQAPISNATWIDVVVYIAQLLALVAGALSYSLVDIVLFNTALKDDAKLYATTIGLIGISFDFLWKFYVALRAFPGSIAGRPWQLFFALLGALVHVVASLAVRLPYYLRGSSPSAGVRGAGTFFYLACTFLMDYAIMPALIGRMFWAKDVSGRRSHGAKTHIAIPLVIWVVVWLTSVMVSLFADFGERYILMEVVLWAPALVTLLIAFWDSRQLIRYDYVYMAFYFWFVSMIPHFTGSVLNFFAQSVDQAGRFFLTVAYIGMFQAFMMASGTLSRLFSSGYIMVHFLFPVQFFEYFFSALFFVDVDFATNILFWFILAAQSVWLTFRNSGLGADVFIFFYQGYLQPFSLQHSKLSFLHNVQFDAARTRLYRQARMAVQYTACDIVCLISVPAQYYMTARYLDGEELAKYAGYFKMTVEQSNAGALLYRFLIIACVKLVFHILAHLLLYYKVRVYNRQGRDFSVEPLSFVHIFRAYLARNWLFLLVVVVYTMRLCYIVFSVLLSVYGTTVAENAPGLSSAVSSRYWLIELIVYTGLRFS